MWHVRYWVDVPDSEERQRKSEPIGSATGKDKLTKPEARRRGAELIEALGINTQNRFERIVRGVKQQTFKERVDWCRKFHKAWTEGKPGPIGTMESQLTKHILPRFGEFTVDMVNETTVQEFVAELRATTFERRRKNGTLMKTYKLSRKTVLNIVGVVKLVLGKKIWKTWELDLGKAQRQRQPYFTEEQFRRIIQATPARYRVMFLLLAGTGMRIGEAIGLHRAEDLDLDNGVIYIRRSVWRGHEQTPKTENAIRQVDIDPFLAAALRDYIGDSKRTLLFESRNGTPLNDANLRNRVLKPVLVRLGIADAGLHAFRHGRVTVLRKRGTPADLQKLWIGHSSLRTGDRYSHTDEELEYRRSAVSAVAIDSLVGPNGPKLSQKTGSVGKAVSNAA